MKSTHQARPTSTPKCGTVQAIYKPKGYGCSRVTPTKKTAAKLYNKASTLT